jgi:hypothetical protein
MHLLTGQTRLASPSRSRARSLAAARRNWRKLECPPLHGNERVSSCHTLYQDAVVTLVTGSIFDQATKNSAV